jgi:anhydro-N-acetylmuramic acid kinase
VKSWLVLGIMSGTSIDSVDYALCAVNDLRVRLLAYWQAQFPAALRQRLHRAASNQLSSFALAQLHHDLGRFYAAHAVRKRSKPVLVGLHGQTVFHNPRKPAPATLQVGEPAYLVERLRVPVISNFRAADLAAGGQGAPLATLFHQRVFARRGAHVCVHNLGGISNVSSLDWSGGTEPRILAFDTGPANLLLDMAIRHLTKGRQHYDKDGAEAAQGNVAESLLARWLKHRFFYRSPPKSTGREVFGEPFFNRAIGQMKARGLSSQDMLATLSEFTARSLALNYRLHLPSMPGRVILTGGGAANLTLVKRIQANLRAWNPAIQVVTSAALGWPIQSVEPAAFALLAYCRSRRKPGNIPTTTGAHQQVLLGQISEPYSPSSPVPSHFG